MTRQEAKQFLTDTIGISEPSNAQVCALLNHNRDIESSLKDRITSEIEEKYKGYVSAEDAQKLRGEIDNLKDASARSERVNKYKAKGLNVDDEDVLNLIDTKLKASKDLDKDLEDYVNTHPSFLTQQINQKKESATFSNMGKSDKEEDSAKWNNDFRAAFNIQ